MCIVAHIRSLRVLEEIPPIYLFQFAGPHRQIVINILIVIILHFIQNRYIYILIQPLLLWAEMPIANYNVDHDTHWKFACSGRDT